MTINPALQRMMAVGGIADLGGTSAPKTTGAEPKGDDFGKMLVNALEEVNAAQGEARSKGDDFMANRPGVDVHDVMIAQEKASTSMQLTLAVRNKALEAFQEINRLPV